ncbi:TonB-dependent receptor plug domain-containing protein [Massilia horti]|uniref:TonB-dependent receptor n=1 Tax=Massilia horti TaxID=2562153 RepID=A0A4Y9T6B7_9BURK|nr:TonB-dependent receptor [Massilia horti]TFW34226.1 TonB-dependent receptor [Massilia horti]
MTKEKVLSRSIRLIIAGGVMFGLQVAHAQEQQAQAASEQPMARVEITGSSIKRIAAEASLPVQTFNQKDIQRSGVNSVTDFIQQLPVMQGFTVAADSVGGGGGGITTASIHDVGETYTLVLLNGRRMAPATSGTTIDINSIPLSAVERIEVLTDGASALYGSDAIAGVVNFILKKGAAPLTLDAKVTRPQHPGGGGKNFTVSKGFGDLETDGYSLYLSVSHQDEKRLKGSQRDFAKTGIINFADPVTGQNLQFFNGSSRSIPPNVSIRYTNAKGDNKTVAINPYLKINKKCPPAHVDLGDGRCYFDYTSSVEIAPEIRRDGAYANGELKLGDSGFKAFATVAYNDAHVLATIAPYPAEFSLPKSSPLFAKYVQPYLTAEQLAGFSSATVAYRLQDLGGRAYDYASQTTHTVVGIDGNALGWDINSAYTWSRNHSPQNYVSGFPLEDKFNAAMAAGTIDPFPYALGEMPAAMITALKGTQYTGNYNTTDILMEAVDFRASRSVYDLPAGAVQLGLGADFRKNSYEQRANPAVANAEILFDDPQSEFNFSRKSSGAFGEMVIPVIKGLEVTTSVRYDRISKITDSLNSQVVGHDQSASTYKISARYQPAKEWMLRGAYGTGFKVASMLQIGQPLTDFGVTGGSYVCPLKGSGSPLAQYCPDGKGQLEAFTGGNPDLGPEKSKQWTFGAVFEPTSNLSAKLDLWHVGISNAVTSVSENLIATDPVKYASLYTTKYKASTGQKTLAIIFAPINIGQQENTGLDYDFLFKNNVQGVKLTSRLAGTWLLKSRYTTPGTSDQWETSLGQFGSNDAVSFRHVFKASVTGEIGNWTHTLSANFRSGYKDKHYDEEDCSVSVGDANGDCADVQLKVPNYYTFDWQTQYKLMKNLSLTAGIINAADKKPPLSLRNTGSHQLGYDPRYASPVGRAFYLSAQFQY